MIERLLLILSLLIGTDAALAAEPALVLDRAHPNPIGASAEYLQETSTPLSLQQAMEAHARGEFEPANAPVLAFGIGPRPVWVHLGIVNLAPEERPRQLSIATAWLDRIDVYVLHQGRLQLAQQLGDRRPFDARPMNRRDFVVPHSFEPGRSEVFLRIETPDPWVAPLYLETPERALSRHQREDHSYGFLYGFLFALLAYNLMLFVGLREARYVLYALYLSMFVLMNVSYTGYGFQWLWPTATDWAQWSQPTLMMLYASCGLLFALSFLDTHRHFPRVHRAVLGYIGAAAAALAAAVLLGRQREALLLAFSYVFLFTFIMLGLGIASVRAGLRAARYFLLAALSAMIGAASTALSAWGFIPFNVWTFRAVEIGMLLDATLLALALSYQFRVGERKRVQAEYLAQLDPLTAVNNRRAFYDKSAPIWNQSIRSDRPLAVILLDLDHFKRVNDAYGHAAGDEALRATARTMKSTLRDYDVVARWGGEEFILLLPETDLEEAAALAERLRKAISAMRLRQQETQFGITASLGVAARTAQHRSLEELISLADKCLYQAKDAGRNRASVAPRTGASPSSEPPPPR